MAIFRIERNDNYSTMSNYHFKDKTLSWKAKGLLSNMLSLSPDWDYSLAGLTTLARDGKTATGSALKELEEHGYLIRRAIREKGKIVDWEYIIFEQPQLGIQHTEKPLIEKPKVENQTQLNTNNNKELKNKELIEYIVAYLNEKVQPTRPYRATTKATQKHINARLSEGYTLDDFKVVIDKKVDDWKGTQMEQYLRPETLFCAKHFESYLNAKINKGQVVKKTAIIGGTDIARREYGTDKMNSLFSAIDDEEE